MSGTKLNRTALVPVYLWALLLSPLDTLLNQWQSIFFQFVFVLRHVWVNQLLRMRVNFTLCIYRAYFVDILGDHPDVSHFLCRDFIVVSYYVLKTLLSNSLLVGLISTVLHFFNRRGRMKVIFGDSLAFFLLLLSLLHLNFLFFFFLQLLVFTIFWVDSSFCNDLWDFLVQIVMENSVHHGFLLEDSQVQIFVHCFWLSEVHGLYRFKEVFFHSFHHILWVWARFEKDSDFFRRVTAENSDIFRQSLRV